MQWRLAPAANEIPRRQAGSGVRALFSGHRRVARRRAAGHNAVTEKLSERTLLLDKADYERLAEFRYLLRRFLKFSEDAADGAGLAAQQHQTLLAVKGYPGREQVTMGELAERLGIRRASASALVDRLAAKGLLRRSSGQADRRQTLVALTPQAEKLLARLSSIHRAELSRLAPLLQTLLTDLRAKTTASHGIPIGGGKGGK